MSIIKSGLEKIVSGAKSLGWKAAPLLLASAMATPSVAAQGKGFLGHSNYNGNNMVYAEAELFVPLIQEAEGDYVETPNQNSKGNTESEPDYLDGIHVQVSGEHDVNLDETTAEYDAAWMHRFYDSDVSVWSEMGVRNDVYGSEENNEHGYLGLLVGFSTGPWRADVEGQVLLDDERVGGGIEIGASYFGDSGFSNLELGAHFTGDTEEELVTGGEFEVGVNVGELFDSDIFNYLRPTYKVEFESGEDPIHYIGNTWYF